MIAEHQLEIAHVLFIDIVGYSKRRVDEQKELVTRLNQLVRGTAQFQTAEAAGKLIRIPTGDGMALAFFTSPDGPVNCAIELAKADQADPKLELRMGIHSGPVDRLADVNDRTNLAGAGINMAQRVMDVGDAGHILLSQRIADDLAQYGRWQPFLHNLGEAEVKHGVRLGIVSLYDHEFGNAAIPGKIARARAAKRQRWLLAASAVAGLLIVATAGFFVYRNQIAARQRAAAEAAAQREKSVAVLPFEDVTTNEQNDVFTAGVHREVLSNLAKVADLKVISRTSVMRYKAGAARDPKQIADELGINFIVEGSVQRQGNQVRVTVELIECRTGKDDWAETYDGKVSDILTFQSEIAQRISNQLGAKLSPRETAELAAKPTQDMAAFESYIRGRALMETAQASDNDGDHDAARDAYTRATQLLEQAVARDGNFAAAYCALTETNIQLFRAGDFPEYRGRAEAALANAQRIAPDAGETLHAQARIIYYGYHDFKQALAKLEQAAKALPNNSEICSTRALLYRRFGRWQEVYAQFLRAVELNPQDPGNYGGVALTAVFLRWFEDGDRIGNQLARRFPHLARAARLDHALRLMARGELDAFDKELEAINPDIRSGFVLLFQRGFWKRDYEEAQRVVNEAAKDSDLREDGDRWLAEAQLAFVAHPAIDRELVVDAERQFEKRLRDSSANDEITIPLIYVKGILGKKQDAIRLCDAWVESHPAAADYFANVQTLRYIAWGYLFAGNQERALRLFTELVTLPGGIFYGTLRYNPSLDDLRKDPRFQEILMESQQPFPRL